MQLFRFVLRLSVTRGLVKFASVMLETGLGLQTTYRGSLSRLRRIFTLLSCLSLRLDGPEILDQDQLRVS